MAVLITYQYDEDPIKSEVAILQTRLNMGVFGTKGQVTLKWIFRSGPNSNFTKINYACPGCQQVWCKFNQNWRHFQSDNVKYGLFRHSRASNSNVNSPIWPEFELIRDFPHYKSMGAFCCHGNQSFVPICLKTLCSLSPTPMMCQIKFD